jgi:hypothetical protein
MADTPYARRTLAPDPRRVNDAEFVIPCDHRTSIHNPAAIIIAPLIDAP